MSLLNSAMTTVKQQGEPMTMVSLAMVLSIIALQSSLPKAQCPSCLLAQA